MTDISTPAAAPAPADVVATEPELLEKAGLARARHLRPMHIRAEAIILSTRNHGEHGTVADDIHLERNAVCQEPGAQAEDECQDGRVEQNARAHDVAEDFLLAKVLRHRVFRRIADQATR